MKHSITLLLIVLTFVTPLGVLAQKPAALPEINNTPVTLEPSERSKVFAGPWNSGKLPKASDLADELKITSDIPQLAAAQASMIMELRAVTLAKMVAAGDATSTPALVRAILDCGYKIESGDGTSQTGSGGQGMAISDIQIASMAKMYGLDQSVSLKSFEAGFQKTIKVFHDMRFAELLLTGIRESLQSQNPSRRFWARFIVELGKNGSHPYDIENEAIAADAVRLDPIQRTLILNRLAGDALSVEHNLRAGNRRSDTEVYRNAVYIGPGVYSAAPDAPCQLSNNEATVMDWSALAGTNVFNGIIEELSNFWKLSARVRSYVSGAGIANIIFTLIKFIATYAALEVKLEMQGTLTRTKTTVPGETKALKATLKINMAEWMQYVNCARPAFNLVGLDFSVPTNGAISNAKVTFVLEEDESTGGAGAVLHNSNIDSEVGLGNEHDSAVVSGVYLQAKSGRAQYTDNDGQTSINVVGAPQDQDLSRKKLEKVERRAAVMAFVQAKTNDPRSPAEVFGTIGDILGPLLALVGGDKLTAAVGLVTEALYRINWYTSDAYPFTIKDWEPCSGSWQGVVTMQETSSDEGNHSTGADGIIVHNSFSRSKSLSEKVRVLPASNGSSAGIADITLNQPSRENDNGDELCHVAINLNRTIKQFSRTKTTSLIAAGSANAGVSISLDGGMLKVRVDPREIPETLTAQYESESGCDPESGKKSSGSVSTAKTAFPFSFSVHVPETPDSDTLHGSTTVRSDDGHTTTVYTWDLIRCRP